MTASPASQARPAAPDSAATLLVWIVVFSGIGLWAAHIVVCAALVRFACHDHWAVWVMHATTVATGLPTLAATAACGRFASGSGHHTEDGIAALSQRRFLGMFGVGVNGISLVLIVVEGIYVAVLRPCA